jgi:phage baseplate assembly protein W
VSKSGFLGSGWGLHTKLDSDGSIDLVSGADKVRESIQIILRTALGERPMLPEFGCGIHELVFAPLNANTIGQARLAVEQALVMWEPRIDLLGVDVTADPHQDTTLLVEVSYRLRDSNARHNLVYPFYLNPSP